MLETALLLPTDSCEYLTMFRILCEAVFTAAEFAENGVSKQVSGGPQPICSLFNFLIKPWRLRPSA